MKNHANLPAGASCFECENHKDGFCEWVFHSENCSWVLNGFRFVYYYYYCYFSSLNLMSKWNFQEKNIDKFQLVFSKENFISKIFATLAGITLLYNEEIYFSSAYLYYNCCYC